MILNWFNKFFLIPIVRLFVFAKIKPDLFIVRGDNIKNIIDKYTFDNQLIKLFDMSATPSDIIEEILKLDKYA